MRERGAYHCGLVALRLATLAARVTATAIRPANRRWPGMKRQKTIRGSPQRLESLTAFPSAVPRSPAAPRSPPTSPHTSVRTTKHVVASFVAKANNQLVTRPSPPPPSPPSSLRRRMRLATDRGMRRPQPASRIGRKGGGEYF